MSLDSGLRGPLVKDTQNKPESSQEFRNVVANANRDYIVEIVLERIQAPLPCPLSHLEMVNKWVEHLD